MEEAAKAYDACDYPKALLMCGIAKMIAEELHAPSRLADTLNRIGHVHLGMGEYERARDYSQRSLELAETLQDRKRIASALITLGTIRTWQGDLQGALPHFQKSLLLAEELAGRSLTADALVNIGQVYTMTGNYTQAFHHYHRALDILKTLDEKPRLGNLLISLGILYAEQGDHGKMLHYLEQSLRIAKEMHDQAGIATVLINMGIAYREQGRHERALDTLQESLRIAEETTAKGLIIYAQTALGSVYQIQGKYKLALDLLNKSLPIAEQIGDKPQMAVILWHLAELYASRGDYSQAIDYSDRAVALAGDISLPEIHYLARTVKGKAHLALKQFDQAQQALLEAIATIEQLRSQVSGGEQDQQRFFQNRVSPYHVMTNLFFAQNSPAEALAYAEQAKARVLLDVLRHGRVNVSKTLSQKEQLEERRLYSEMVFLNAQIRAEQGRQQPDDTRMEELEARLQKARTAYEAFQTALYTAHPGLKAKRGLFPPFTMEEAEALLPDTRAALLEYVVTDEQTFLFALSRTPARRVAVEVKAYSIEIRRSDLYNLIEEFRKLLAANHPGFRQPGRRLYELLVKPAEPQLQGKTSVCVVPDGLLWELPFQALQTDANQYLLERYAMYYAPSLQVLREMRKKAASLRQSPVSRGRQGGATSPTAGRQLFAVGNPAIDGDVLARVQPLRNAPFVSLPETEKEVQAIGTEVYGVQASTVLVGDAAREEAVKSEMKKYRVIHFATHGALNDRSPLYSYLLLAGGADAKEDGLLEAWELMEMDLKAEMAVLSACDTARGHAGNGEGMIGMTWALFVAGVPTTVATQWAVPSESTTKLPV